MEDWITYAILGGYGLLFVLEALWPGRSFRAQPLWRTRGVLMFGMFFAVGTYTPLAWDEFLYEHQLIDARALGTLGGAAVGLLAYELISYFWHRAMHRVPWLFRHLHQTHHSVERMDMWGAFTFHPVDLTVFTLLGSVALVWLVGVTVEAALLATLVINLLAAFGHANLRTPRWLGYFIARPEQHAVHHQRGVHAYNYADLPIIDLLFGTFRNPERWKGEAGYYDGASLRLGELLVGLDVTEPPASHEDDLEPLRPSGAT